MSDTKNNKVALITGGSRGIGKAIAKKFASEGYDLVINYRSDNTNLEELEKELKQDKNIDVLFVKADVSKFLQCEDMAKKSIEHFGKIDVLINNSGITKDNLLMRMKEEEFEAVIDVNLKGTFNVTKNIIPYMIKQRKGKIVNISSVVGVSGNAGQANYAASKAGIIGFTKSIAKELASRNILANCIAPGFIKTDMTDVLNENIKNQINLQIPLKKMGEATEVANATYFLASEENTYITGQVLNVDGGMLM
jgi:3-oxoacyl-[acyl-carrier protein] reductase